MTPFRWVPRLTWSFNGEGECDESLRPSRDEEAVDIDVERAHGQRRSLTALAPRPQCGVDAMRDRFTGATPCRV